MQQEIQRAKIRQFKALHFALHHFAEEMFYAFRGYFANQHRIMPGVESDYADVRRIAFIARTGMRDAGQLNLHSITCTEVWISSRGISAGQ